jgi:cobalt-zinc-cadmium efflux system outer membrane protein
MIHSFRSFIMVFLAGALIGCASYRPEEGFPQPRKLGIAGTSEREYRPSGAAEVAEPTGDVSLQDCLSLALTGSPKLAASFWEVHAAEARRLQAGLLPNPEAEAELEGFSGDRSGASDAETRVVFSQPVLLGGKRTDRTRVARYERDAAGWEYESMRLRVLTDATIAFFELLSAQRVVELTRETVRIANDVEAATARRVEAGAASPVELTRAQVASSSAEADLEEARNVLLAARVRLASTWGSSNPRFATAVGDLEIDPHRLPPLPLLRDRLAQNPELKRHSVEVVRQEAALDLEKSKRFPDLTVRFGYQHIGEEEANTLIAGFALPLPIFDRNQGGVAEARAHLARSEWNERVSRVQAEGTLLRTYAALETAIQQQKTFREKILPGALSAFESVREGYDRGKFNLLELLSSQRTLAETRRRYTSVLVSVHEARARLEGIIGAPLVSFAPLNQETDR